MASELLGELVDDPDVELRTKAIKAAAAIAGSMPSPAGADQAELAAWVIVGRSLMNLDEFITRE